MEKRNYRVKIIVKSLELQDTLSQLGMKIEYVFDNTENSGYIIFGVIIMMT